MLKITNSHSNINILEYQKNLYENGPVVHFNIDEYVDMYKSNCELETSQKVFLNEYFSQAIECYNLSLKDKMIRFLIAQGLEDYLCVGNSDKYSLDKTKVIQPLVEKGLAQEILYFYLEYSEVKSTISSMKKLIERDLPKTKNTNIFGESVNSIQAPFNYNERENLRYYTANINVQQIKKNTLHTLIAPSNYVMVKGDFSGADAVSMVNLVLNDKRSLLFFTKEDTYESFYNLVNFFLETEKEGRNMYTISEDEFLNMYVNFEPSKDRVDFKKTRDMWKNSILTAFYGKNSGDYIFQKCKNFFKKVPKYKTFIQNIKKSYENKYEITLNGLFGTSMYINPSTYGSSSKKTNEASFISKCTNTPIQCTTSEYLIIQTNSIMSEFSKIPECKDKVKVYFTKHDEVVFLMHKDVLEYSYIFQSHEVIDIKDTVSMKMKFKPYLKYGVNEERVDNIFYKGYKEKVIDIDKTSLCMNIKRSLIEDSLALNLYIDFDEYTIQNGEYIQTFKAPNVPYTMALTEIFSRMGLKSQKLIISTNGLKQSFVCKSNDSFLEVYFKSQNINLNKVNTINLNLNGTPSITNRVLGGVKVCLRNY